MGILPARDIVMLSTADEESSGERGIQWMLKNHLDDVDPAYVLDEGGAGSRDLFSPGKTVFGIGVGESKWSGCDCGRKALPDTDRSLFRTTPTQFF